MNPLLIELPMPIETPRLLIRGPRPGDGPELRSAIGDSFMELSEWMPWATNVPTPEEAEVNVREASLRFEARKDLRLMAFEKGTSRLIVSTGLHRFDWDVRKFEIGYWVRTPDQGKGYVTEAVNALTRYAFGQLRARRVEIRCDSDNRRSLSVARRLGFEQEGILRRDDLKPNSDQPRDTVVFSLLETAALPPLDARWPGNST